MGGTIQVDIAALRSLATRLSDLARLLDDDNDKGTRIGDWVSDPRIGSALSNIQHDWSNKRGEITGYLTSVSRAAAAAAEAYGTVEQDITKAAQH
jgi:ABC-type transporter Mla subunit MlaD